MKKYNLGKKYNILIIYMGKVKEFFVPGAKEKRLAAEAAAEQDRYYSRWSDWTTANPGSKQDYSALGKDSYCQQLGEGVQEQEDKIQCGEKDSEQFSDYYKNGWIWKDNVWKKDEKAMIWNGTDWVKGDTIANTTQGGKSKREEYASFFLKRRRGGKRRRKTKRKSRRKTKKRRKKRRKKKTKRRRR